MTVRLEAEHMTVRLKPDTTYDEIDVTAGEEVGIAAERLRALDDHDADVVGRVRKGPQVISDGLEDLPGPLMFDLAELPLEMVREVTVVLFPVLHKAV